MRNKWLIILAAVCLFLMAGCGPVSPEREIYPGRGGIESRTLYLKLLTAAGKSENDVLLTDDLSGLRELRIADESNFSGMELLELGRVETLTLERCNLTDGVLPRFVTGLTSLKRLNIHSCGLMTIPEEIANCAALRELSLVDNQLSDLPVALQSMERLNLLDLSRNQFNDIPAGLQRMNQLVNLNLSQNAIVSLSGIIGPNQLDTLNLSGNRLKELPESLLAMDKLQVLLVADNRLLTLPSFLNSFAYLTYLDVRGNAGLSFNLEDFPAITVVY